MIKNRIWTLATAAILGGTLLVSGCGSGDKGTESTTGTNASTSNGTPASGSISIDGSSTVYPIVNMMGEDFGQANSDVKMDVTKSGTGSGFKKFAEGSVDICVASRTIEEKEEADLKAKGLEYIEVPIAYDGVSLIANPGNAAVDSFTVDELKKAWASDSKVTTWADIRAGLPAEKVTFYGPTDNHGTYEYFTEKICGKKNDIRKEYQPNQEYSAIIQAIASDKNGFAYVGYSYYIENKDKVKIVKVDGVEPTPETIASGTYKPLSRTLFLYVSKKSYDSKPAVKKFLDFALGEGLSAVQESKYIELPKEAYDLIKERVAAGKTGSIFAKAEAGKTTVDVLKAEAGK